MKNRHRVVAGVALVAAALVALGWFLLKDAQIDVLNPTGAVAVQQRNLFVLTVVLSLVVVVPVFTLLGVFAWKYRADNKKARYKPEWAHSSLLEVIWWGIPIVIIVVLAVITWQTSHSLDPYKPIESKHEPIKVQVVALQWKWLFLYPDLGVATLNKLPVPKDVPVHFTLTADAPMSAFWIPSLGSMIYTMNGMSSQLNLVANKTGDYKGYNTNINGEGYSEMVFNTEVREQAEFDAWVAKTKQSPEALTLEVYEELAKPGSDKRTVDYVLVQPDLYQTIVDKYMKSVHDTGSADHGSH